MTVIIITRTGQRMTYIGNLARILDSLDGVPKYMRISK